MTRSSIVRIVVAVLALALFSLPAHAAATQDQPQPAAAKKKGKKGKGKKAKRKRNRTFVVCKHGCKYRTIQQAVNKSGRKATIKVRPGTYREGVIVRGKRHNGLTIMGTRKNPRKVVLNGKNAKTRDGSLAQNGIEGINVRKLTIKNMWAKNYATNGFFVRDSSPADGKPLKKIRCRDFRMKNLLASFNRSYGMYAFGCIGGRITHSTGWGHGDSAFYIGATPIQKNPKWTTLDHLDGHENVLGYSGTNSRYVDIKKSDFYNNGIGIVPNTLESEPYMPSSNGKIRRNNIFWNNFNYFLPNSRVKTVSNGIGEIGGMRIQFPTGTGIVLLGSQGWTIRNNEIFGNFMWGVATVSNPLIENDVAMSKDNRIVDNAMGRDGTDENGWDFFADGSGEGNCFSGNTGSGPTFDPSGTATNDFLYPECPAPPSSGTGTSIGDPQQFAQIVNYAATDPSENQECHWKKHSHPKFKKYKPLAVTPGPECPF